MAICQNQNGTIADPSRIQDICRDLAVDGSNIVDALLSEGENTKRILVAALLLGELNLRCTSPETTKMACDLVQRGLLSTHDRLAQRASLTPAGHRLLSTMVLGYVSPAGLYVHDRWNDPTALLFRIHALKTWASDQAVNPDEGAGEEISADVLAAIDAEVKRIAEAEKDRNRAELVSKGLRQEIEGGPL